MSWVSKLALVLSLGACACGVKDDSAANGAPLDRGEMDGSATGGSNTEGANGPVPGATTSEPIGPGDIIDVPQGPAPGAGSGGAPTPGSVEDTCDGIDNDQNGIVDDVDVGQDGICDCLRIATLGAPGTWGEGDVFATWLDARSANGAVDLADAVLTPEVLAPFHILVIQDVSVIGRSYEPSEVDALLGWVNGGGGLMTLIGYADPSERANVNTLLAPFQVQYGEQQVAQRQGGSTLPIGNWFTHPITEGIDLVGSDNGYPVEGADDASTLLAETDNGDPLGRARTAEAGHVFVWGDEWITYNSEWLEHQDYQVELFWVNSIKWLTVAGECQVPVPASIPRAPR